ncbi:peptidase A8 [Pelagibacteraceae bacterium GOM-A4]|nr:peptidase A8 [Pelagibacteraceae bacterium GOM-A4]
MGNEKLNKLFIGFIFLVVCFALDRISKIYILNILNNEGQVDFYVNQFLNIYLVWNTGIGFGLFSSEDKLFYNLFSVIIVIINFVILYFAYIETKLKSFFLMVILGGSLGNLFDRFYYNAVPDFIDLNYDGYHWFIFNVADIFITIGIICLIFSEFIFYKKNNDQK